MVYDKYKAIEQERLDAVTAFLEQANDVQMRYKLDRMIDCD